MEEIEQAQARLAKARLKLSRRQEELTRLLIGLCPGQHKLAQHRDMQPPWCDSCGRDASGGLPNG